MNTEYLGIDGNRGLLDEKKLRIPKAVYDIIEATVLGSGRLFIQAYNGKRGGEVLSLPDRITSVLSGSSGIGKWGAGLYAGAEGMGNGPASTLAVALLGINVACTLYLRRDYGPILRSNIVLSTQELAEVLKNSDTELGFYLKLPRIIAKKTEGKW